LGGQGEMRQAEAWIKIHGFVGLINLDKHEINHL
jgi:hypothetical protein